MYKHDLKTDLRCPNKEGWIRNVGTGVFKSLKVGVSGGKLFETVHFIMMHPFSSFPPGHPFLRRKLHF